MTTARVPAVEPLLDESIHEMLHIGGPCISLFLPPYRQGALSVAATGALKSEIQDAARLLRERKAGDATIAQVLDPLEELAKDPELAGGHQWARAVFGAPEGFRQFLLPEPVSGPVTVAGSFLIRPLLAQLHVPRAFYMLALSKKGVALFRCAGAHAEKIALPKGVEETIEAMEALEPPDHDLENRSAAGSAPGAMRRVRFGTGSGRETQSTYLADYYKSVDRGMSVFLHAEGQPLVLVGVEQDIAIYQKVNTYPNLLREVVQGSPDGFLAEEEMVQGAYAIVRADYMGRAANSLAEANERTSSARLSTELEAILHAAFEGRVSRLYINEDAQNTGIFERGSYRSWGAEDLLNLAAVETLRRGGDAWVLPGDRMPKQVAAIFRY
jgi:hypothetical protein